MITSYSHDLKVNGKGWPKNKIVHLERFLATVLKADAFEVARALKVSPIAARRLISRAHDMGLVARLGQGIYSVRPESYRQERREWGIAV